MYSVFLICTSINSSNDSLSKLFGKIISKKSPPPIKGQLLLGAYLFIIKSRVELPPIAILQLAHGYTNIPGFIAYSKLGFEKDLSLYGEDCFKSLKDLPMSNYWIARNTDEIIQAVTTVKGLEIDREPIEIINFYKSNKNVQKKERLGVLLNILYRMELQPNQILTHLINVYNDPDHDDDDNNDNDDDDNDDSDDDDGDDDGDDETNYDKMQRFFGEKETDDLTEVFYNKTIYFNPSFVTKEDYEKCIGDGNDDNDSNDYRNCHIQESNYPEIIKRIQKYYKKIIKNLLFSNDIFSRYKRKLNVDDVDVDVDCDEDSNNKKCKIARGGKRQKTNKKHRQYKKKTTRILKNKPKYKSKKLVKNRKHSKNQKNKNYKK